MKLTDHSLEAMHFTFNGDSSARTPHTRQTYVI